MFAMLKLIGVITGRDKPIVMAFFAGEECSDNRRLMT